MKTFPLSRWTCDRCKSEEVKEGEKIPLGWSTVSISGLKEMHICTGCSKEMAGFLTKDTQTKKRTNSWTPQEDMALLESKKTIKETAKDLGRTYHAAKTRKQLLRNTRAVERYGK